jgi:hypothetical protein
VSKPVRLPDYLHAEIEKLAAAEKRSLANMVQVLLEQALRMKRWESGLSGEGGVNESSPGTRSADVTSAVERTRDEAASTSPPAESPDPHFKPDPK